MRILILGGSGYLGQFAVHSLAKEGHQVTFTYATRALQQAPANSTGCKVDLVSGHGLKEVFLQKGPFDACINCAAISQPGACEQDPELARSVNIPLPLLTCLNEQREKCGVTACLIHLSTDQVYDGSRAWWKEEDVCAPVNAYGSTKLEGEQAVQARWPPSIILRSSIIFGPEPTEPVNRPLFIQWLDQSLANTDCPCPSFFEDEWRCPTYVHDILRVCHRILELEQKKELGSRSWQEGNGTYNMGGPDRLSRLDMAHVIADIRGYDKGQRISGAKSASVPRPVRSPQDISMRSDRLEQAFGFQLTPFRTAVSQMFSASQ